MYIQKKRKDRQMKKGYFFSLDIIFSILIVAFVTLIFFNVFYSPTYLLQAKIYSSSVIDVLSMPVFKFNNIAEIREWNTLHPVKIKDENYTIAQQAAIFFYNGNINYSSLLVNYSLQYLDIFYDAKINISGYNMSGYFNDDTLFQLNNSGKTASLVVPARQVVYFVDDDFSLRGPFYYEVIIGR